MTDYTPDMDAVREDWMQAAANSEGYALVNMDPPSDPELRAQFDRFIAKIKADTWDDAIDFVSRHYEDYLPLNWDAKARINPRGKHE